MRVSDTRWEDERFHATRKEVLARWPTGAAIDLPEAFDYHASMPSERRADVLFASADATGRTLVQPRHGDTLVEQQIETLQHIATYGGADIVSTEVDAYTRQLKYDLAASALEESREANRALICGVPVVAYGVPEIRRLVEAVNVPSSARMASSDARLPKEIFLAAGFTYVLMGPLQNMAYEKDAPIERLIEHYQYEDQLIGRYEANGAPIVKECSATLTGTLVPPAIGLTTSIIDGLLAARQGVKRIVLSYALLGNLAQDVAAIRLLRELGREYMQRLGYADVDIYTTCSQWMGDFPQNESQAYSLVCLGTTAAALGGATQVIVKSLHEAFGVPSKEANAAACRATRELLDMLRGQRMDEGPTLRREMDILRREVHAILDRTLELGDGDLARGTVRAFEAGIIDVPFSPSRWNAGRLMPARDSQGAVRMLDTGNLPLPKDVVEFHRERLAERGRAEQRSLDYAMVVDDVFSMSRSKIPSLSDAHQRSTPSTG